jgi:hypothetical protein
MLRLILAGAVGEADEGAGHTGLPAVIEIEPAGNVIVDNVEDEAVVDAARGNVVVLLSEQLG